MSTARVHDLVRVPNKLIDHDKLPGLAYDLALGLEPTEQVLLRYGLGMDSTTDILLASPEFERLYLQARREVMEADNSTDRVRLKAKRAVEDSMDSMAAAVVDVSGRHTLAERSTTFGKLAKIAGLDDPPPPVATGSQFVVNISIPGMEGVTAAIDVTPGTYDAPEPARVEAVEPIDPPADEPAEEDQEIDEGADALVVEAAEVQQTFERRPRDVQRAKVSLFGNPV